jgi:regulation of enolase protein 1 (concanavalin A-like superfamily)
VGTLPDRNWRGAAFDFGDHFSPDGVIEYKNGAFGGALQGKLIVARYSGGDDLIVLGLDAATKNVSTAETGAPGTTGFVDPLDLVENAANGHLYVSEYGARRITLLRPTTVGPLPAPWSSADIGATSPAGSATFGGGTYTVRAAGADIYGNADAFHFASQPRAGNFTITARVTSLQNTNAVAKAGVMIRETLVAGAKNAFVMLTPTSGAKLTRRTSVNGATSVTTVTGYPPPAWVRVQRQGTTFRGYVSGNGTTWTQIGSVTISMTSSVYAGLAVTSHANGTLTTASFTDVTVQ